MARSGDDMYHADDVTTTLSVDAVHRVIKIFGTSRCFFASNYPVDVKDGWPAPKLFAAFKKLASQYDEEAQKGLFAGNAKSAYRV